MARLEAVLDANISPFQKKLEEAQEKAAEFKEKLGDVGSDLLKSLSGINIGEALGLGIGLYAAKQLGDALIDAAKEGYKEFQKFQDAVLSFKYTLPSTAGDLAEREKIAKEEAEAAEARTGAFDFETQYRTAQALIQASRMFGESVEKTDAMAKHLTALAIITRSTPEVEAENLRRALVSRAEDSGAALGKFFKRTPGLEEQARTLREEEARRRPEEAAEIRRMGIPEFMAKETRGKTDEEIIKLLTEMIAKAAPEKVIEERRETHPEEALIGPLEAMRSAFGEKLLPVVKEFTDALVAAVPAITEAGLELLDDLVPILQDVAVIFKGVATAASFLATNVFAPIRKAMEELTNFIREKILTRLGEFWAGLTKAAGSSELLQNAFSTIANAIKSATDIIMSAVRTIAGWLHMAVPGAAGPGEASSKSPAGKEEKALEEGAAKTEEAGKEYRKSMEEAAMIQLKADATHAENQRRLQAEAEAFDIRAAAKREAGIALHHRAVGATEELDKEYAARAEEEAKIINIRAEAAIKINAADEAAAEKIDKIKEEADERSLKRAEEDRNTFGMTQDEIDARSAVRRAEDAASASAISDAKAEAAEKIREADIDAANQIIDAQEAAAEKIIDAQEAAALAALDKMEGPYKIEEAPEAKPFEFGHWMKGGGYEESEYERKAREDRNKAAEEANKEWKTRERMAIQKEFEEKKLAIEDALERERPTMIGLKRIHAVQQEEQGRVEGEATALEKEMKGQTKETPHIKLLKEQEQVRAEAVGEITEKADVAFQKGVGAKWLKPPEPKKEGEKAGDVSRRTTAELIIKYLDMFAEYKKEFESVFVAE